MTDPMATSAGSHAMLLYPGEREYLAASTQFLKAGWAVGAAVLVAGTREHLDRLDAQLSLGGSGTVLCDLTSRGADPGRVLSMIRMFALENAGRPVRCIQEVGWLGRPREHLAEAIVYEALLCRALAGSSADVLCSYNAQLDTDLLAAAGREHPVVSHGIEWRASAAFARELSAGPAASRALSRPPADAAALTFRSEQGEVRRFTAARAHTAGLPAERVTDLVIAIGELAGNTLLHTDSTGTLTIWTTADEIICQVSDSGQIEDPLAGTLRPAPNETGSRRGLWLVHEVSDLVQIRTGSAGTTVRVHMRLPTTAAEPATFTSGAFTGSR